MEFSCNHDCILYIFGLSSRRCLSRSVWLIHYRVGVGVIAIEQPLRYRHLLLAVYRARPFIQSSVFALLVTCRSQPVSILSRTAQPAGPAFEEVPHTVQQRQQQQSSIDSDFDTTRPATPMRNLPCNMQRYCIPHLSPHAIVIVRGQNMQFHRLQLPARLEYREKTRITLSG